GSSTWTRVPPRGLDPSGLFLLDKPAGPSAFSLVRDLRERTGARAGHAGTLDPFATGLLLVLLGRSTKLAQRFVGLDKRYLTEIDLAGRATTGDPGGERRGRAHDAWRPGGRGDRGPRAADASGAGGAAGGFLRRGRPPDPGRLGGEGRRRAGLPAASQGGGGGDAGAPLHDPLARARRLRRPGRDSGSAGRLRHLRPRDRRRARRALSDAATHRGRSVPRRGRRPDADHAPGGGSGGPVSGRAIAIGTFDGVHLGHRRVIEAAQAAGLP